MLVIYIYIYTPCPSPPFLLSYQTLPSTWPLILSEPSAGPKSLSAHPQAASQPQSQFLPSHLELPL